MTNELAVYNEMPLQEIGQILVQSGFFSDAKSANQAIVKVLAGRELGFGPIASMTGVYIVRGKPVISANLMASAVKRDPRYDYRVDELSHTICTIVFSQDGKEIGKSSFSIDDAKKAGLSGDNWNKYPRNMLFARALSNGVKWYCPDALGGAPIYTPDEMDAAVDENGEIINGTYTEATETFLEQPTDPILEAARDLGGEVVDPSLVEQVKILGFPDADKYDEHTLRSIQESARVLLDEYDEALSYQTSKGNLLGELADKQLAAIIEWAGQNPGNDEVAMFARKVVKYRREVLASAAALPF